MIQQFLILILIQLLSNGQEQVLQIMINSIMEFTIKRRSNRNQPFLLLQKKLQCDDLNNTSNSNSNSNFTQALVKSLSNSLLTNHQDIESTIYDEKVRAQASKLLSTDLTTRRSTYRSPRKRQAHISWLYTPKKRTTIQDIPDNISRQGKERPRIIKPSRFLQRRTGSKNHLLISKYFENENSVVENSFQDKNEQKNEYRNESFSMKLSKKQPRLFYKLTDYFQLAFSKFLSKNCKQKSYILVQDLAARYEKYPETISQDVQDIRSIASKLELALGPKDTYVQLRPFEALQVNGQLARLIFHLVHELTTRKYKNYDLIKIYKQIEYCSRRLQFHNFTLKICFQIGELYKQSNQQLNSHAYFVKALKLSIFLNDKFHEQKAIDCFGLTAYRSNKSGQANYFHRNCDKLSTNERQHIQSKYSNDDEMQKISTEKNKNGNKYQDGSGQKQNVDEYVSRDKRKETFKFVGDQLIENYEVENKRKFKENISQFIQCPEMRTKILIARNHMNKIDKIGKIGRFKNFQTSRLPMNFSEDVECSSEIYLTHRSSNRRNPELQIRTIEKERKNLLELISYYTNQIISPSHQ